MFYTTFNVTNWRAECGIEKIFKSAPDIQWQAVRYFGVGDEIIIEVLARETTEKGEPFKIQGCDLLTLQDGKIISKRAYLNEVRSQKSTHP